MIYKEYYFYTFADSHLGEQPHIRAALIPWLSQFPQDTQPQVVMLVVNLFQSNNAALENLRLGLKLHCPPTKSQ